MIVLGLTGSIGMGKTTVAAQFESQGAVVCSADAIVHGLLAKEGAAVAAVVEAFPESMQAGAVDRSTLASIVFHDPEKLQTLELILHPLVVEAENAFLATQKKEGAKIAVLEIPLLYETGAEARCHKVAVCTAPHFIQKWRVLRRADMSETRFNNILALQMPDHEKRARADFLIHTGFGRYASLWQVKSIVRALHA